MHFACSHPRRSRDAETVEQQSPVCTASCASPNPDFEIKVIFQFMLSVYFYSLLLVVSKMCCRACENKLLRDSKINVSRKVHGGRNLIFKKVTFEVVVICSVSPVWLSMTPWTAAHQVSLSFTISQRLLLNLGSIKSVMPSNHLVLCHPLLLLPSIFPSIRVFSNESALCIRWPKY